MFVVVELVGAADNGLSSRLGGFQPEGDSHIQPAIEYFVRQVNAMVSTVEENSTIFVAKAIPCGTEPNWVP